MSLYSQALLDIHDKLIVDLSGTSPACFPCLAWVQALNSVVLFAVFRYVIPARQALKVLDAVIQWVSIDVVNHMSPRQGSVLGLPNHNRTLSPLVWFPNLHPCTYNTSFVNPEGLRSYWESIVRRLTPAKLSFRRGACALSESICLGGTPA